MIDLKFVMAGKATFTVENPKKKHYTYQIKFSKKINKYFVYLLTGPNNENSFTYMGMLINSHVKMTQASKYSLESLPVKVFNWVMSIIESGKSLPNGYFLEHNGSCGRCGKKLTTPESIKMGLGPICRSKMQ